MASELRVDKIVPVDGVPTGGGGGVIQVVFGSTTSQASRTHPSIGGYDTHVFLSLIHI